MAKFNDGKHIAEVLDRTPCRTHSKPVGTPCWEVRPDSAGVSKTRAACGARIKAAGFVGKISETAIQSKRKATDETMKEVRA